jgi:tRNA(Ile)-lysidine synthase
MSADLRTRLLDHLKQTALFDRPGLALLAVSGGPDSVALLDLMHLVGPEFELELAVGHVEHGIQSQTLRAAEHVRELANCYSVPCHIERLSLGAGTSETSAREASYGALRLMQERVHAQYVVTAHQRDDQIETVLYRFLRGSGIAGLAGIPARGPRGIVRPLLPFHRRELADWLAARALDPATHPFVFQDPANEDQRHDRVWLRRAVLPIIRDRFGADSGGRILDLADDAAGDRAAWAALLQALPDLDFARRGDCVEVAVAPLQRYDKTLSVALLRAVTREVGCHLGQRRAARLLAFAMGSSSGRSIQLGSGWQAELVFSRLRVRRDSRSEVPKSRIVVWGVGVNEASSAGWGRWEFNWCTGTAETPQRDTFFTWVTPGSGEIRGVHAGDRMLPLGGVGRRKVRRLLMEAGIPASERAEYPVIVRGNVVLWIPGVCRSADEVPQVGTPAVRLDARPA